jgi:hypothetical protein
MRFVAYFVILQKTNIAEAYRALSEDDFKLLGFDKKPNYELLREFVNERIGEIRFKPLFDAILKELCRILKERGIKLGNKSAEDATDIRALKHDKEAAYSAYYKECGYKVDIVSDIDLNVPLHFTPLPINEHEGKCTIHALQHMRQNGIIPSEMIVDDSYTSYENIAYSEHNGTSLIYEIQQDWVFNPAGTEEHIKRVYQKYHKEPDFRVNASVEYMVKYLYKKGKTKLVGAYYRNKRMREAKANLEAYRKKTSESFAKREGFIGYIKTQTGIDSRPPQRGWKTFCVESICNVIHGIRSANSCSAWNI